MTAPQEQVSQDAKLAAIEWVRACPLGMKMMLRGVLYRALEQAFARFEATIRANALEEANTEIKRLRGLLIDPGSPAWENARSILAAELRKANLLKQAEQVVVGEGVYVPSWIALNLMGQATRVEATIRAEITSLRAQIATKDAELATIRADERARTLEEAARQADWLQHHAEKLDAEAPSDLRLTTACAAEAVARYIRALIPTPQVPK